MAKQTKASLIECGISAVARVAEVHDTIKPEDANGNSTAPTATASASLPPAEQKAVAEVESKSQTGPLSWGAIIGGTETANAPVPGISTPTASAPVASAPPATSPFPWEVPGVEKASVPTPPPPPVSAPAETVTWMSIIGGAPSAATDNQPTSPAVTERKPPPVTEAEAEKEAQRARDNGIDQPLSWASIIGADDKKDGGA